MMRLETPWESTVKTSLIQQYKTLTIDTWKGDASIAINCEKKVNQDEDIC